MSESEIRRVLREVCEELDRAARHLGRVVLPAALGAGVALASGCGERAAPVGADGKVADQGAAPLAEAGARTDLRELLPPNPSLYSVPSPTEDARPAKPDLPGPIGAYGVPEPEPDYMAPMYSAPMPGPDAR